MSWIVRVSLAAKDLASLVAIEQERRNDLSVGVRVIAHTPPNLVVELSPPSHGARDMGRSWSIETEKVLASLGWEAIHGERERALPRR